MDFKLGDVVKILQFPHYGRIGKISVIFPPGMLNKEAIIKVSLTKTLSGFYKAHQIKRINNELS